MKQIVPLFFILTLLAAPAFAATDETNTAISKNASGLPLPRFASLRSDEVNMRTGPGTRYPIEWVLKQKGLPVEIIAEFEIWRRIKDPEGAEGWVHISALSGKRTVLVTGKGHDLKKDRDANATIVAHLENGALGHITACDKSWCKLKFDDVKGYLPKNALWGAYANEVFD